MKTGIDNPSQDVSCPKCGHTGKILFRETDGTYSAEGFDRQRIFGEFQDPRIDVRGYDQSVLINGMKLKCTECGYKLWNSDT